MKHRLVGHLGPRIVAHRKQHLAAPELRLVAIAGPRVLHDQPVQRLQRRLQIAALLVGARHLVQHAVIARILGKVLQVLLVQLHGGVIVGRAGVRLRAGGPHIGQIHLQIAEAAHRLGSLRIFRRRLQEFLVRRDRALLAAGDFLVRNDVDLAACQAVQRRRRLGGGLLRARAGAQRSRAQPGQARPPHAPYRCRQMCAKVHGPRAGSPG